MARASTLARRAFSLAHAILFVGLACHRQHDPAIGPYSIAYLLFLAGLASLAALPRAIRRAARRFGARQVAFSLAPLAALTLIGYPAVSIGYANLRAHPFDPFLQAPPQALDPAIPEPGPARLRVVALGGSTTEGAGLPTEARYPSVLERELSRAVPSHEIEVHNAGRAWYTTKHSLINYVTRVREWTPDIVVVMHGVNDLCRSFVDPSFARGEYDRDWSHYYGAAIRGAEPVTLEDLWWGGLAERWFSRLRVREERFPLDAYVSLVRSRWFLETLVAAVRADGATPVLVTQSSLHKDEYSAEERRHLRFGRLYCKVRRSYLDIAYPSPDSLRAAMDAYAEMVREVADAQDVVLVDARNAVPRDLTHFADDVHHRPAGARRLGETVARALVADVLPLLEHEAQRPPAASATR